MIKTDGKQFMLAGDSDTILMEYSLITMKVLKICEEQGNAKPEITLGAIIGRYILDKQADGTEVFKEIITNANRFMEEQDGR